MTRKYFLHPFLFAVYPVVFLFAQNIQEFRVDVLPVPLSAVLIFAALLLALLYLLLRRIEAAAIVASFLIIGLLYYNRIIGMLDKTLPVSKEQVQEFYPAVLVLGFGVLVYLTFRCKKHLFEINKVLSVITAVLVIFPLFTIISYEIKTGRSLDTFTQGTNPEAKVETGEIAKPDIYYIIFDRYAGKQALIEQYDFDNSTFYTELEKRNFYVADEAKTNYPKTFLSLASSLNMEYLDTFTGKITQEQGGDESIVTPYLRDNKVINFLKDRGYTIVNIGSWWTPTQTNPQADVNYFLKNKAYFGADEFTTGYINTTIAGSYLKNIFKDPTAVSKDPNNNIHRSTILYELNAIKRSSEIPGPKFVFVHLPIPHDPFVFDKNCKPIAETVVDKNSHQVNYINQLQCANKNAIEVVDLILKSSDNKAVILLQSDEGPFPMNVPIPEKQGWGQAEDTSLREKFPILQAYHLSKGTKAEFYENISPVNSFRVIFNSIFGQNYPLLPDKNYVFEDEDNYYNFTEVTERVQ